jgi:hypothetical protein
MPGEGWREWWVVAAQGSPLHLASQMRGANLESRSPSQNSDADPEPPLLLHLFELKIYAQDARTLNTFFFLGRTHNRLHLFHWKFERRIA